MNEATQRLFFALWPDAATSNALAALAQQVAAESGGRPTAPGNVHLTLAFLGDQPRRIPRELSAAAATSGPRGRSEMIRPWLAQIKGVALAEESDEAFNPVALGVLGPDAFVRRILS